MSRGPELLFAELGAAIQALRAALARGEVPDPAPLARGIARLREELPRVPAADRETVALRLADLEQELTQLVEATAESLARTRNALEASARRQRAFRAYRRGVRP